MRIQQRLADRFILCPSHHVIEAEGLRAVRIPCSGGAIETFFARVEAGHAMDPEQVTDAMPPPQLLVIKLPGTAGRAERSTTFPATLVDVASSEIWTWNPPGYGRSGGRAALDEIARAVLEFFDFVAARRRGAETRVWICGNSLGCATALYLASRRPVDGLVLRNPPPLVHLVRHRDAWWNFRVGGRFVAAGIPAEMDATATAPRVNRPAIFIESGADTLVTPAMQQRVRQAYAGPQRRILLAGAAHDTPIGEDQRDEVVQALQWLWDHP